MSFVKSLASNPALVLRHRNILLLSHMRANTSLFGHLLGSHPLVEGYYEMHIGYYSWKSLWRQKLMHFADHDAKPGARYMFDKVLHDDHSVAIDLLKRPETRTIMMARAPLQSVKSLMVLYRETNPHLPEATAEGAVHYYCRRLQTLASTAAAIGPRYFYLDAERLVTDAEPTLAALSAWLRLPTPIPTEYDTFANTGRGNAGDTSSRLKSGRISRGGNSYADVLVPDALMAEADEAYRVHREALLRGAEQACPSATAPAVRPTGPAPARQGAGVTNGSL